MRAFVITGAGVSAESGIPTFRGKEGYWRNLDPAKLATPGSVRSRPKVSLGMVWRTAAAHPQRATECRAPSDCETGRTLRRVPTRHAERGRPARACGSYKGEDGANSWGHLRYQMFALRF